MNNLPQAQAAYDAQRPPQFRATGQDAQNALESAATAALEALQSGKPTARLPLAGAVQSITVETLLTWINAPAAELLLAACSAALKQDSEIKCRDLLRSFAARVAAEYADDNVVVYQ